MLAPKDHLLDFHLTRDLAGAPALETLAYCMCRFASGGREIDGVGGCDCLRSGKPPCVIAMVNARVVLSDLKKKAVGK